ncbi:alpha-2-macroglobulin-P-like [Halichoeres trimaculatus]|uniref:alpha-2-macroglobulin-P-like n=1 Tax=Halichoeres trimaculatus TaxID=147232 RepID=UPI003D9F2237
MAPVLQMIGAIFTVVLLSTLTSANINNTLYAVTVSSQLTGGCVETVCAQIHLPIELPCPICLRVTIEMPKRKRKTLIMEEGITSKLTRCFDFKVPKVKTRTVANISVEIEGDRGSITKTTKVLIVPPVYIFLVRTDKPIYKPGQTVLFRIVSLNTDFLPVSRKFKLVELVDANSNRIAQWVDLPCDRGILDLSHPTDPGAVTGTYTIAAITDKKEKISQSFQVKKFVLPKFEVTVQAPSAVTIFNKEIIFKVCGKYTYGKPVSGSVKAVFCRKGSRYWWIPIPNGVSDCGTFQLTTDKSGCASQNVTMAEFFFTNHMSLQYFEVTAEMMESGTGSIVTGSRKIDIENVIRKATFVDVPPNYKPGLPFPVKVKLTGPGDKPVANEEVFLSPQEITVTTDSNGMAEFSLDTTRLEDTVTLTAKPKEPKETFTKLDYSIRPRYISAYHTVLRFYSKSNSFVKLLPVDGDLSCDGDATLRAKYIINKDELLQGQDYIKFFILVMSKGEFKKHEGFEASVVDGVGETLIKIGRVINLAPVAQVVIYTLLLSGEMVADSMNYPIQLCFRNKVSLKFPHPQMLPAQQTKLHLKAQPGSLCSVKAIDLSILLLEPEQDLTVDFMYNQLPVQKLSGYSYDIEDGGDFCPFMPFPIPFPMPRPQPLPIEPLVQPEPVRLVLPEPEPQVQPEPEPQPRVRRSLFFPPFLGYEKNDVYSVFKEMGIKIVTNRDVDKPCPKLTTQPPLALPGAPVQRFEEVQAAPAALPLPLLKQAQGEEETVRSFFPETWIWDLVTVGDEGSTHLNKTVPDTITKWVAGAFCVSPVGFGVSPNTGLTAFKPFFVSLTLPYSVIRGESFRLRATVFNHLSECIQVEVTLANSDQHTFKKCDSCQYTVCLCSGESMTFTWTVTPTVIGHVGLKVRAEALKHTGLCGNKPTTVPKKGHVDTVIRELLVEAEGTPKSISQNALLCPKKNSLQEKFSLMLPENFVEGSVKASVSVLGDLMGRALKNIDKLLEMPYGCGEQNMLKFAPNIFILRYLDSTGQLTSEIKDRGKRFLVSGYQRQLGYKHKDGSYSAFGERDDSGNTWLSGFVMKSFGEARDFIYVDPNVINQARVWLSQQQGPDGCIQSVGKLFHKAMKGGVRDEVTLTAYIAAAMLELNVKATDPVVKKCMTCLKTALNGTIDNLYVKALLSYTFTLAGEEVIRAELINELHLKSTFAGGTRHLVRPGATGTHLDSLEVEMTSYLLLALLSGPALPGYDLDYSATIVGWLVKQQNEKGGFSSTQDTVVALQALSKYAAATFIKEGSVTVTVSSMGGQTIKFTVVESNRLLLQEESLSQVPGEYTVQASGTGCVLVQVSMTYNIPPPPDFSKFEISINTAGECSSTRPQVFLFVKASYLGSEEDTNMVILDIKLLSGYTAVEKSLKALLEIKNVKRVEVEEGHVLIYLDKLYSEEWMMYGISLEGDTDMGISNQKPAVVKIYDYYQTSDEASTQYTSPCA